VLTCPHIVHPNAGLFEQKITRTAKNFQHLLCNGKLAAFHCALVTNFSAGPAMIMIVLAALIGANLTHFRAQQPGVLLANTLLQQQAGSTANSGTGNIGLNAGGQMVHLCFRQTGGGAMITYSSTAVKQRC
jgi:hypothetical protein